MAALTHLRGTSWCLLKGSSGSRPAAHSFRVHPHPPNAPRWQCRARNLRISFRNEEVGSVRRDAIAGGDGGAGRSVAESRMEQDDGAGAGKSVFIFGMGYTSLALANSLRKEGWTVSGTCRSEEKREALELRGFRAYRFNPDNDGECLDAEAVRALHASTHIVSSIPPVGDFDLDPVLASHRDALLQAASQGRLRWIGYLSSTSVYGDWQGAWVGEDTLPRPAESRAVARWEAEKGWMQLGQEAGVCVHIFRLGGIYGPGRSALDTIRRGEKKLSSRQQLRGWKRFTSRVHVADICQVLMKAMALSPQQQSSRIYNVVDDDPTPRADVMAFAEKLLHGNNVEDEDDDCHASEEAVSDPLSLRENSTLVSGREVSEKRVLNQRVKDELQVQLLHPSFRSGLQAIAKDTANPFN